jgi:hypothetical protein
MIAEITHTQVLHSARATMFTRITPPTHVITQAQELRIAQITPQPNQRLLVQQTRHVLMVRVQTKTLPVHPTQTVELTRIQAHRFAKVAAFTRITSHTLATTQEHQAHIAQTTQQHSLKVLVLETRLVATEPVVGTIVHTTRISNAKATHCIGMTRVEPSKTANTALMDATGIRAQTIIIIMRQYRQTRQRMFTITKQL